MMTGARGGAPLQRRTQAYAFYSTFLILPAAGELPVRIHHAGSGISFRPKCAKVNELRRNRLSEARAIIVPVGIGDSAGSASGFVNRPHCV